MWCMSTKTETYHSFEYFAFANAKLSHVSFLFRVLKGTALGLASLSSCKRLRRSSSSPQEKNHSRETQLFMWPELSTSSVSFWIKSLQTSKDVQKARKSREKFSLKFGNSRYVFVLALTVWCAQTSVMWISSRLFTNKQRSLTSLSDCTLTRCVP